MYHKLLKKVEYAKRSCSMPLLYEAKGAIDTAREAKLINAVEYFDLNHQCVYEGINNPEIFNHPNNR